MGMTEAQRERRRKYVGASDVGAVLGEDPWRTPADVWVEKVHGIVDDQNEAMRLGNHLEAACKALAGEALGVAVTSSNPFRVVEGTRLGVNLDAWFDRDGVSIPVECKTAGLLNPWGPGVTDWGEDGTDEVPTRYILQVHAQMMATGAKDSYISALIPGRGHAMFQIQFDEEVASLILKGVEKFWTHVENRTTPDNLVPNSEILARIRRVPETVVALDSGVTDRVIAWQNANKAKKTAEDAADEARNLVLESLGLAEGAVIEYTKEQAAVLGEILDVDPAKVPDKLSAITFLQQSRAGIDQDKLRYDHPLVFREVRTVSRFRVLRLKKQTKEIKVNSDAKKLALAAPTPAIERGES